MGLGDEAGAGRQEGSARQNAPRIRAQLEASTTPGKSGCGVNNFDEMRGTTREGRTENFNDPVHLRHAH